MEESHINCPSCETEMLLREIDNITYRECPDCGYIEEHYLESGDNLVLDVNEEQSDEN